MTGDIKILLGLMLLTGWVYFIISSYAAISDLTLNVWSLYGIYAAIFTSTVATVEVAYQILRAK